MSEPIFPRGWLPRVAKIIPSLLTVANLALGIAALMVSLHNPANAALLIVAGMVLDGLDGRAARWLKAESEFGKELDSLSDIVTFGVAPAFIMYQLVLHSLGWVGTAIGILFPVCGALRLARFNVQRKSTQYFVGLPITAAGGVLATMALYRDLLNPSRVVLPVAMVILALLMVSRARYPNFKKVAFPKSAFIMVPVLAFLVYFLFRYHHAWVNRIIFVPLAMYALYGAGRLLRWRRISGSKPKQELFKSNWK